MANSPDDLLSFKEFDLLQDDYSTAQLNIDSPLKKSTSSPTTLNANEDVGNSQDSWFFTYYWFNGLSKFKSFFPDEGDSKKNYSFLSLEYYQQFFDVDTLMVVERIVTSMIPKRAPSNYLKNNIGQNPDLYGPFWIIVTLVSSSEYAFRLANHLIHFTIIGFYHSYFW